LKVYDPPPHKRCDGHQRFRTSPVGKRISQQARAGSEEDVKRAIQTGFDQTTVTCVLIGAHTWQDRWVRHEIARSVERGNGLFAVRINGIADPSSHQKTTAGWNPLASERAAPGQLSHFGKCFSFTASQIVQRAPIRLLRELPRRSSEAVRLDRIGHQVFN
jgi:MTH538 TIR-like domain (DUF1863)